LPYVSIFVAKILKLNDIAKKKGEKKEAVFTFETASGYTPPHPLARKGDTIKHN
jgi:hypothetical protein